MFETLITQYLKELVQSKIGDFPSPQPLHSIKVQRLGRDKLKSPAKVCSKFEMPIFALVRNMPEQTDNLTERHQLPEPFTLRLNAEC